MNEIIKDYIESKAKEKELSAHIKELSKQVKELATKLNTDTLTSDTGEKLIISQRESVSVDEDKMVAVLKENGYTEAISTKEVVNEEVLETLIYENKLSDEVLKTLEKCQTVKTTQVLKIKDN